MNQYESVIIINSNTEDSRIKDIIETIKKKVIENNGNITNVEELGLKKLAYEVKKCKEGYYVVIEFKTKPEIITELERYFRITEEIIKFITIRKED